MVLVHFKAIYIWVIVGITLWIAIILSRIIVTFPNCPMSAGGSHSPGTIFFFVGLLIWQKTYVLFVNDVPWQPLQTYLCTGPTLMVSHHLLIWHQHQSICSQYLIYSFKTASSACIKANCCPEPLLTFSKKKNACTSTESPDLQHWHYCCIHVIKEQPRLKRLKTRGR